MEHQIYFYILGIALGIVAYFLKATMDRLKAVEAQSALNSQKCTVLEGEYNLKFAHINEKIDELHIAVKDLTIEIKSLTKELHQRQNRP
jgi:hypothetical protein